MRFARTVTALRCIAIAMAMVVFISPEKLLASVMFQAHNMRFSEIEKIVPSLATTGITHIQISPPQKSNSAPDWWARYQPLDFSVIEGPLGNESELRSLSKAARAKGLKIVVDVVLNHMANTGDLPCTLAYPQFSPQDFHGDCKYHRNASDDPVRGWLGNDLPDLRTESPRVREVAKQYLQFLIDMGADGFRFDAAGHIDADFFREMSEFAKQKNKFIYGEVLVHYNRIQEAWRYTPYMSVTDYPLLARMVDAFGYGGDLRVLKWPSAESKALPGTSAITFVNNHDVHEHPWDFGGMALDSRSRDGRTSDMMLAQSYILGRGEGFPILFRNDVFNPLSVAGVKFHESMLGQPEYMRAAQEYHPQLDSPSILIIERGTKGLVIINKGTQWVDVPEAEMPGLAVGCYLEDRNNFQVEVGMEGDVRKVVAWGSLARAGMSVGPRDALFLRKISSSPCSF